MMIDKKIVKYSFNKASIEYNKYAKVQVTMANKLIDIIKKNNIKTILEIGCGTGNLTNMILENFKDIDLTVIDLSEKMLNETKKNILNQGINIENIKFICEDGETCELNGKYDLIISNATFQWFNSLGQSIEKYVKLLNEGGQLLISTFGEDTFIELEESGIKAAKELNIEHNFQLRREFIKKGKLEDILKNINKNYIITEEKIKEYHKNSREFLKSVKKIGANICSSKRIVTPPNVIKKVLEIYNREFLEKELVYTTYHCIYISIYK